MSEAYKQAGVDIAAGNDAVARIKAHARKTFRPEVLTDLGSFGSCFAFDKNAYTSPVLVSATDGVGTKLKIAFAMNRHGTIGIDAVAMCVNDIASQGAEPLFFLDYLACGRLEPEKVENIVKGVAQGCELAGCALIGGETAEMPGIYDPEHYDLAGFAVGVVERERIIDGATITPGDVVIGLGSSGLHSNGYSLVRKVLLEERGYRLDDTLPSLGLTLGEELLKPTRIYVGTVLAVMNDHPIKGVAHITGGGFYENIPRILPEGTAVEVARGSWPIHPIFKVLQQEGALSERDAFTTFNMGIGMVLIVAAEDAQAVLAKAQARGEQAYRIGRVTEGARAVTLVGAPTQAG